MIWLASGDGAFSCVSLPHNTRGTSFHVGKGPAPRNILISCTHYVLRVPRAERVIHERLRCNDSSTCAHAGRKVT